MAKESPTFTKWFVAQFGKRPSRVPLYMLNQRMEAAERDYLAAKDLAQRCRVWDDKKTTAYKGWEAGQPEKPE